VQSFHLNTWVVSQKSENNLGMAESELDKQTNLITDLTKKVDDLQEKADQAGRLKDQVDE
jgi:protein HOOK3